MLIHHRRVLIAVESLPTLAPSTCLDARLDYHEID